MPDFRSLLTCNYTEHENIRINECCNGYDWMQPVVIDKADIAEICKHSIKVEQCYTYSCTLITLRNGRRMVGAIRFIDMLNLLEKTRQ